MLREKCSELAKCSSLKEKLDSCSERVSGKSNTTEDCTEELFDFVHCIDHCVSFVGVCSPMSIDFTSTPVRSPLYVHRWQRIYSRS